MDTTTQLIATNHGTADAIAKYAQDSGMCGFCGHVGSGLPISEAVNHDYFNDDPLMQADTGHVCRFCAYCMNENRALKQGHWIATPDTYERISTSDLPAAIRALRAGEYATPYALHVTRDPILSQHSYHWTPLGDTIERLTCAYARQTVRVDWPDLDELVAAVEDLRWHGLRLDDIRSGEPRVRDLESVGRDRYRELSETAAPYRRTPTLEVALTLSRARDDQNRDDTTTETTPLKPQS